MTAAVTVLSFSLITMFCLPGMHMLDSSHSELETIREKKLISWKWYPEKSWEKSIDAIVSKAPTNYYYSSSVSNIYMVRGLGLNLKHTHSLTNLKTSTQKNLKHIFF